MSTRVWILGGDSLVTRVVEQIVTLAGEVSVQPNAEPGVHAFSVEQVEAVFPELNSAEYVNMVGCVPCDDWRNPRLRNFDTELHDRKPTLIKVVRTFSGILSESTQRWAELVSAFVTGGAAGMAALGASRTEIAQVEELQRLITTKPSKVPAPSPRGERSGVPRREEYVRRT